MMMVNRVRYLYWLIRIMLFFLILKLKDIFVTQFFYIRSKGKGKHNKMLKKRYGTVHEVEKGRQWRWEIPEWSRRRGGPNSKIMDSDLITTHAGVDFHFHLVVEKEGVDEIVGFYIHHKKAGIPKYTYALGNTKGRVACQYTAHSIPEDCKRCGHRRVVNNRDLTQITADALNDICVLWFQLDEDSVQNTNNTGELIWSIPRFAQIRIGPYYSKSFPRAGYADMCAMKIKVDPKKRANVILSVSQTSRKRIPCWIKCCTLDGSVVYESAEPFSPGRWPSIRYSQLTKLGRDGALVVYVRYVKVCVLA